MLPSRMTIYAATTPVDLRRSFDGLAEAVDGRVGPLKFEQPGSNPAVRGVALEERNETPKVVSVGDGIEREVERMFECGEVGAVAAATPRDDQFEGSSDLPGFLGPRDSLKLPSAV